MLCLLWVPRPDDRRESFKDNPADAYDAPCRSSLNPSNHSVEVLRLLWVPKPDDRRESCKHNPADADDALSPGSLHPSKHSVEVLRLLWVPRPDDPRESFKHNPADADDALSTGCLHPSKHRSKCCAYCGFQGQTIGERVLNTIQLMLMMLPAGLSKSVQSFGRSAAPAVGSKARRSEREF